MKTQSLIVLFLVFVMSCKSNQNNVEMKTVKSVLIAKGNLHGAGSEGFTKENSVIDNQSDWESLMARMNKVNNVSESFTETKIDFSKYAIIAVFNDVKGSGGHSIELNISTTSENTLVTVKYISPSGNATSVMTQPYYITKIPKQNLPIVFE
ncbi:protease complex subunit PrcB family protein [Winogradskyella helgolandensis]|uniref:protease complex subunit PrcB family protein n=1 Tax=Winogradskyella helgolandensis TaxID=2697010 RepID=UPI0015BFC210|nr:protease complex subunit PrcB family protein [Winogradskyella helgolandensis]